MYSCTRSPHPINVILLSPTPFTPLTVISLILSSPCSLSTFSFPQPSPVHCHFPSLSALIPPTVIPLITPPTVNSSTPPPQRSLSTLALHFSRDIKLVLNREVDRHSGVFQLTTVVVVYIDTKN